MWKSLPRAGFPSKSVISMRVRRDEHDLVLAELDRLAGVLDECGDVAGEVVLAPPATDDERGVAPGADHDAGGVRVDREQRERALQPAADPTHGLGQYSSAGQGCIDFGVGRVRPPLGTDSGQLPLEQVRGALGVGVAGELDAARLEFGPQLGEVLDDAVVDHR